MSTPNTLNLFPARVPIGKVRLPDKPDGTEGDELNAFASIEFLKALKVLFDRVGGTNGTGNADLIDLVYQALTDVPAIQPSQAIPEPATDYGPAVADLARQVEEIRLALAAPAPDSELATLRAQVAEMQALRDGGSVTADVAALRAQIEQIAIQVTQPAPAPNYGDFLQAYAAPQAAADWEHPGKIGARTANSGTFTTLTTSGGATFQTTSTALTNGAAAGAGTITNAPAAGNPTKWIGINDNGTIRYIPAW